MVLLYSLWTITASLVFCSLFDHCSAWPNPDNEPLNDLDSLPLPPSRGLGLREKALSKSHLDSEQASTGQSPTADEVTTWFGACELPQFPTLAVLSKVSGSPSHHIDRITNY